MSVATKDLWSLVLDQIQVDPDDLAWAIEEQIIRGDLDFRSQLLIRDSVNALESHWGPNRLQRWLANCKTRETIESIWHDETLGEPGFRTLPRRIMETTRAETIKQYLREIADHLHRPVRVEVAGAASLILQRWLDRRTEDVDVINEVPEPIRVQTKMLDDLAVRYGLEMGHVQSHYFPSGWDQRLHSMDLFGPLKVFLLDVYDIFLSKLFSKRTKDYDDLRVLLPQLDKDALVRKLRETASSLLAAPDLRALAKKNWENLIPGETLPA